MSRTYRHTKPEYVYRTDDDGFVLSEDWEEARKHYEKPGGWRLVEKRARNRRLRHDRAFAIDFDDYTMPNNKMGYWD